MALYERRADAREPLFHPGDATEDERPSGPLCRAIHLDGTHVPPSPREQRVVRVLLPDQ